MGAVRPVFEEWKGGQRAQNTEARKSLVWDEALWKVGAKLWGLWVFNILVLILQGKKNSSVFLSVVRFLITQRRNGRGIKIWQRTTCLKNNEPARPKQPSADLWKADTVSSGKVHAQEDWLMLHMDLHLSGTQWHCTELEAGLKEEQTANCYKSKPIVRR